MVFIAFLSEQTLRSQRDMRTFVLGSSPPRLIFIEIGMEVGRAIPPEQ